MFNLEKIDLTFSFPLIYFIIALLLLAGYAFYVYRYTIPTISTGKKTWLLFLRILALLLLLFIIFEPILTLTKKTILEPLNLVFIDNSRSILIDDGTNRDETINQFISDYRSSGLTDNSEFYSFGNEVDQLDDETLDSINFSEGVTDFSEIFSGIERDEKNISSIIIISDGIITDGSNPIYSAERLGLPVFTIGVGDSSTRRDVEIKSVLYNEIIYAETPTTISAAILNKGFGGKNINVSLYENDELIEQQNITLNEDGLQNLNFTYAPKSGGEQKLTLSLSNLEGEFTFANNKRVFFVNVLTNKIKAAVIAGAPSTDLSFIKNSLKLDENLDIKTITQVASGKFLENNNRESVIDSADILFLIGFPSKETPDDLLKKVSAAIKNGNKSYFFLPSANIDFTKLGELQSELPFIVQRPSQNYTEIQPNISADKENNSLLKNNSQDQISAWNNLPPVYQQSAEWRAKPESEIVSRVRTNNVPLNEPLIVTRQLGRKRSIAVLAKDIWKWKLQTAEKNLDLFDQFILNSVKWLNTAGEQKKVKINTTKKIYSLGEPVEFIGQVYDEAFNPVSDAEVKVSIRSGSDTYVINLGSLGSGLYEGTFQSSQTGDFSFSGEAFRNGSSLGKDNGRFNIGEIDIEFMNPAMDYEFLNLLANQTSGGFYFNKNYNDLFAILKQRTSQSTKEKLNISEINLWSNEWLLIIIIVLFALEWFFRKRWGML